MGFADEDFEAYVREEARDGLSDVQARAAEWMLSRKGSSQYAASNVAGCLHAANRGEALLTLVEGEPAPACIVEPVLRREAELQRLRLAARVCTEAGDRPRALKFLLISAEGARSENALKELLLRNPDLAVRFASETTKRLILSDPDLLDRSGSLLFCRLVVDAERRDAISVREGLRATARVVPSWRNPSPPGIRHFNQLEARCRGYELPCRSPSQAGGPCCCSQSTPELGTPTLRPGSRFSPCLGDSLPKGARIWSRGSLKADFSPRRRRSFC